jgi:hypothetical protein
VPINAIGSDSISHQETIMNQLIRAGVVTLGIVGSAGFAAASKRPATTTPI